MINVAGIAPGALKLDGPTLGNIFLGKIKTWNDPAIAALNPGVKLPDGKITVVHRSDGSGTTFNFVNYLSKVNNDWKTSVGEGTSVQWPVGIGGKGNEGVAAYVKQIKGSIGYVEFSYALQNRLTFSRMKNAAGNFVQPRDESFSAAAASADWANARDFYLVMTNAPGEQSWPITATNFILMRKQPKTAEGAKAAVEYFRWIYANGDTQARQLDYVPLPDPLVRQIETYWQQNLAY
ncbi:Phosphate-binding protein PstS precursor [compost metagenome]